MENMTPKKQHNTMTTGKTVEIFVQGLTKEGKQFRPSDWVDRMCSSFATFGENRKLRYSPYLRPEVLNGVRCLAVDMKLKDVNPEGFEHVIQFADENQLNILDEAGNSIEVSLNS
jgi:hypothetical protein